MAQNHWQSTIRIVVTLHTARRFRPCKVKYSSCFIQTEVSSTELLAHSLFFCIASALCHFSLTLTAAIAVLCKKPEVANHIFTNPELNEFGVYTMSFFQNRQPVQIVVDDRLPVFKGQVMRAVQS
jgi:hypothetical protein